MNDRQGLEIRESANDQEGIEMKGFGERPTEAWVYGSQRTADRLHEDRR